MTNETGLKVAYNFLKNKNPSLWDGTGEKPDSFNMDEWTLKDSNSSLKLSIKFLHLTTSKGDKGYSTIVNVVDNKNEVKGSYICFTPNDPERIAYCVVSAIDMALKTTQKQKNNGGKK